MPAVLFLPDLCLRPSLALYHGVVVFLPHLALPCLVPYVFPTTTCPTIQDPRNVPLLLPAHPISTFPCLCLPSFPTCLQDGLPTFPPSLPSHHHHPSSPTGSFPPHSLSQNSCPVFLLPYSCHHHFYSLGMVLALALAYPTFYFPSILDFLPLIGYCVTGSPL